MVEGPWPRTPPPQYTQALVVETGAMAEDLFWRTYDARVPLARTPVGWGGGVTDGSGVGRMEEREMG